MKFLAKKIYIILFLLLTLLFESDAFAKENQTVYTDKNISNYFLGIISSNQNHNNKSYEYLKKVQLLKERHSNFNIEFIRTLVLLEKFDQAFAFSKSIWDKDELFFEADLLLGIDSLIKKDYTNADKYFERLNTISRYNLFFQDFIGNVLIAWSKAAQENKNESFKFLEKVPDPYRHLVKTQNSLLMCYFKDSKTEKFYEELINDEDYNFSRYSFFLANHLLFKNKNIEAKKLISKSRKKNNSNILIKQAENFLENNKSKKIKNFFNCENSLDSIAEFFYILANFYASEQEYQMSNFYLKISLFLNDKFTSNKALLAENLFYQGQRKLSEKAYDSLKPIGPVYSWFAARSIASILLKEKGKIYSIKMLENEFNLISNPNFEDHYELANFYKDNEYYNESITHYSLALEKIKKNHHLVPKILDRRGTSFERLGDWEKAEKDLLESLKIIPDQAHVLNYLAYSWVDKGINLDKGLEMLKKASELRKDDGYIIDSLGWAYYAKQDYVKAEKYLQRAVELMPSDPIVNDHYADALWMLKKDIQARYFWKYVLKLNDIEQELKEVVKRKLIFGITKKL